MNIQDNYDTLVTGRHVGIVTHFSQVVAKLIVRRSTSMYRKFVWKLYCLNY